jgi:hypothetical protein
MLAYPNSNTYDLMAMLLVRVLDTSLDKSEENFEAREN